MVGEDANAERVAAALVDTRFDDVRWLPTTGSTNADVLALARDGAPEGVVVVADHQTAGRGRQSRTWTAPAGSSLLVSVLLRPPASAVGACTMALAVAAARAIERCARFTPKLKWPNDLVWPGDGSAADRKLAGILAEADWPARSNISGGWSPAPPTERVPVVAGIGINCNWPAVVPDELVDVMVAINHVTGEEVDRVALLLSLLRELDRWYLSTELLGQWRARSATLGRRVRVDIGSEDVEGVASDLTAEGHLVVTTDDGGTRELAVGDVVHLRTS